MEKIMLRGEAKSKGERVARRWRSEGPTEPGQQRLIESDGKP
jgi:hypothetical protein